MARRARHRPTRTGSSRLATRRRRLPGLCSGGRARRRIDPRAGRARRSRASHLATRRRGGIRGDSHAPATARRPTIHGTRHDDRVGRCRIFSASRSRPAQANRLVAWVDASEPRVVSRSFTADDVPTWPEMRVAEAGGRWHGLMTSVTAAGNGFLSHGLYRGLAPDSCVVLVQVGNAAGITSGAIARALTWLRGHAEALGLTVVSLSVGGDEPSGDTADAVNASVAALVDAGVVVVAAAGNDGRRHLVPPATAPDALTVGGLDDRNLFDRAEWRLWHSNYGETVARAPKPEVVAPSMWTVAPILPGTDVASEASQLLGGAGSTAIASDRPADRRASARHAALPACRRHQLRRASRRWDRGVHAPGESAADARPHQRIADAIGRADPWRARRAARRRCSRCGTRRGTGAR